jgi:hypothetical protein
MNSHLSLVASNHTQSAMSSAATSSALTMPAPEPPESQLDANRLRIVPSEPVASTVERRWRLLSESELLALPDPEWTMAGLIPEQSLVVLYGPPGVGKTFLALDWAKCIAAEYAWQGRAVKGGRTLLVAAEGGRALKLRIAAWNERHATQGGASFHSLVGSVDLRKSNEVRQFLAAVEALGPLALVVFDTLSRSMPGGDENAQKDMSLVVQAADRIREATGGVVVFCHHTRKSDDEMRGSSVLPGASDSMFKLVGRGRSTLTLSCVKQKDADPAGDIPLRLARVSGSLVVEADPTRSPYDVRVLAALQQHPGAGFRALHQVIKGNQGKLREELARLEAGGQLVNRGAEQNHAWYLPGEVPS